MYFDDSGPSGEEGQMGYTAEIKNTDNGGLQNEHHHSSPKCSPTLPTSYPVHIHALAPKAAPPLRFGLL